MPTTVQGTGSTTPARARDVSPPPTPEVRVSIAFERAAKDATFQVNSPPARPSTNVPVRDPVYVELHNVEVGTTIQVLNLSENPGADWSDPKAIIELPISGRDVANRQVSAYLTAEQMEKLQLKPGHMLQLRAVDTANPANVSGVVTTELQANEWQNGRVQERVNDAWVQTPGAQFQMLDGESRRVGVTAKSVFDTAEPKTNVLLERMSLVVDERFSPDDKALALELNQHWNALKTALGKDTFSKDELAAQVENQGYPELLRKALKTLVSNEALFAKVDAANTGTPDGLVGPQDLRTIANFNRTITLRADASLEPGARVRVQNQRTNAITEAVVGQDRRLSVPVNDAADGDPLRVTVTDDNGVAGQPLLVTFDTDSKTGVGAPPATPVLPGVIE